MRFSSKGIMASRALRVSAWFWATHGRRCLWPVCGFVNRAVVAFRIAETLGQKRMVVVLGEPLGGKLA